MPLALLPYQEQGAEALARRKRFGLFDEMGVGKTAEVIRGLDRLGAMRGIIVCPAVARENWRGEFAKFAHINRRICKGVTIHDFVAWKNGVFDVLCVSYELATKWAPHVHEMCEVLDFVVFDEGHYLKSPSTKRAEALLGQDSTGFGGLIQWAISCWWVTGTPVPNDPIDIYTFLRFCHVMPLDQQQFVQRYFDSRAKTYSTAHTVKASMLPELQSLIANNSIRRTLAQTGVELPPIFLTSILVDGDTQAVRDLLMMHPGLDTAIKAALETGSLANIKTDHVATLRRLIGEAKAVPYAATLVYELTNGLDKMVTFGLHRVAMATVRDYLARHNLWAVMINGDTSEKERQAAMLAFQSDPTCRVMLGQIKAAGTALTMTASAALDMLESDWSPAPNAQAIKRVHRISQTRSVRARFITLARSFDEDVNRIVSEKTAAVAALEG